MFIQIIALFILSIFLLFLIKNNLIRRVFAFFLALFLIMESFSVYIGGNLIDYKFYIHANFYDIWVGKSQWILQGSLALAALFIVYFALNQSAYLLTKIHWKRKRAWIAVSVLFLFYFVLFTPHSIGRNIYDVYKIISVKDIGFERSLKNLGIDPEKYVKPGQLKAKGGKNILIISMESLERGFLTDKFKNVTSHLQQLAKELTFFSDMPQGPGSGWTSASLYTFLTGVPALMPGKGNERLLNVREVKITGLGHVFKKAGYDSRFLISEADFSGTRDLLKAYKIQAIDKEDMKTKYPHAPWGLYDFDLFQEAKKNISDYKKKNQKFALILSTISTHPPHGVVDERMRDKLPEGLSNHEFSIATLDYLVGDLMDFLKKNNLYENTAVYIFPDHKLMGAGSDKDIFDRLGKDRKLYMISNVDSSKFSRSPGETIYQIDLPRLIIEGTEINTNANFLTDFIKEKDKIAFLKKNIIKISLLNKASLAKRNFEGDIHLKVNKNDIVVKATGDSIRFSKTNLKKGVGKDLYFHDDLSLVAKKKYQFK